MVPPVLVCKYGVAQGITQRQHCPFVKHQYHFLRYFIPFFQCAQAVMLRISSGIPPCRDPPPTGGSWE